MQKIESLVGKFLLAMPSMDDPLFLKSVILICGQDEKGIVGFIINRPIDTLSVRDLFIQLKIPSAAPQISAPIYFGGPVDTGRGFVLHSPDYKTPETIVVLVENQEVCLTNRLDILLAISKGRAPCEFLMALGYVGWDKNQLEQEIHENLWILTEGKKEFVFGPQNHFKWERLYEDLGVNPENLSLISGQA